MSNTGRGAPDWQEILASWSATLAPDGARREYPRVVRAFIRLPSAPHTMEELSAASFAAWRADLIQRTALPQGDGHLAPDTIDLYLAAMRSFCRYCARMGLLPAACARWQQALRRVPLKHRALRGQGRPVVLLSPADKEAWLQAAAPPALSPHAVRAAAARRNMRPPCVRHSQPDYSPVRLRDIALVAVCLATGARPSELAALTVGDVGREPVGELTVHLGSPANGWSRRWSGGTLHALSPSTLSAERTVALPHEAAQALSAYLAATARLAGARSDTQEALWLTRLGRPLRKDSLRFILRTASDLARVCGAIAPETRLNADSARHALAAEAIANGASFGDLARWQGRIGHRSLARYSTYVPRQDLRAFAVAIPVQAPGEDELNGSAAPSEKPPAQT
jgi:site-specific recombinase XerD